MEELRKGDRVLGRDEWRSYFEGDLVHDPLRGAGLGEMRCDRVFQYTFGDAIAQCQPSADRNL